MLSILLVASMQASAATRQPSQDTLGFRTLVSFPVTDTTELFERPLGAALLVQIHREMDVNRTPGGWYVAVVRRPADPDQPNLLYHSYAWHGPYPTDLLAWIHAEQYYPDERVLPVYEYPYELRLRCAACTTTGTGADAQFTAGTVEIAWRRLRRPVRRDD